MNQNKPAVVKKLQERFRNVSVGRGLYIAFVMPSQWRPADEKSACAEKHLLVSADGWHF